MPVKNALPYLDAAVESILNQSHGDFEFVIRDDHSTDGSLERLRYWAARDQRIRLFEGDRSLGPSGSSNWVVAQARAPLVARMDADDISLPDRLRRQLEIFDDYPGTVLVGSVWEGIDREGRVVREPDISTLRTPRFGAPFAHGSIMFKRKEFDRVGRYREECEFWEDLDLFVRLGRVGSVLVSVEPLYRHRFSETSTRLTSSEARVERAVDLMFACRRAHERGEDYAPLLARKQAPASDRKHNPDTLLSLAFVTLWSGLRPPVLRKLVRRGDLGFDKSTARAVVWALWATASPRSLRFLMRLRLRRNNRRARRLLAGQKVVPWRPEPEGFSRSEAAGSPAQTPVSLFPGATAEPSGESL